MTEEPFLLASLGAEHDREFRRRIANCFVAVDALSGQVAVYYTIAATSVPLVDLPQDEAKRLPRYPTVPAVRIGRLAVDERFQGRGLGGHSWLTLRAELCKLRLPFMHSLWTPRTIRLWPSISATFPADGWPASNPVSAAGDGSKGSSLSRHA